MNPLVPSAVAVDKLAANLSLTAEDARALVAELWSAATSPARVRAVANLVAGMRTSDPARRRERFADAARIDPTYFRAHSFLGHAALGANDVAAALVAFDAALAIAPDDLGALLGRAKALHARDPAEGVRAVRAIVDVHGERPETWTAIVQLSMAGEHWDHIWRSCLTGPRNRRALETARRAAVAAGRHEEAEAIAQWLRTAYGAGAARSVALELLGATPAARRAAWWADNARSLVSSTIRARAPRTAVATASSTERDEDPPDFPGVCAAWEAALPVDRWRVNGLYIWPLIRLTCAFRLLAEARGTSSVFRDVAVPARVRAAAAARDARVFARQLAGGPSIRRADVLFHGTSSQRVAIDGIWYDRLLDPIADAADELGLSTLHLEFRGDGHEIRAPTTRPAIHIRPAVLGLLRELPSGRAWEQELEGFDELVRLVPFVGSPALWARKAEQILRISDYWEDVLSRVQPRVVVCVTYTTALSWGLLVAANRLGVPFVDLQHGVTSGHPAYERWTKPPPGGHDLVPERFWSWTKRDAARIEAWGARAVVGGHPWIAHLTKSPPPPATLERGAFNVLVSLNWSSGFPRELMAPIRAGPPDWVWWVRLHPMMHEEREAVRRWLDENAPGRAFVDAPSDLPLPSVVTQADAHLTMSSTVTQEAARLGVPTVTVDPRTKNVYAEEIASGWARYVSGSGDDVVDALRELSNRRSSLDAIDPYPGERALVDALAELATV